MGHISVIRAGTRLFDHLIVAIADNPAKTTTFSAKDRLTMLKEVVEILKKDWDCSVSIRYVYDDKELVEQVETLGCRLDADMYSNEFTVDYARRKGAEFLLRGIRGEEDLSFEMNLVDFNSDMETGYPLIQTIWVPCRQHNRILSSSFVKGLCGPEGWQEKVRGMVPECVFRKLLEWKGCPRWIEEQEAQRDF
jgi:pantetheine-phosphate adenylyltransferase